MRMREKERERKKERKRESERAREREGKRYDGCSFLEQTEKTPGVIHFVSQSLKTKRLREKERERGRLGLLFIF
jgi:hypothetical protein